MTSQDEADQLLAEHQTRRQRPRAIPADPMVKAYVDMPASLYQQLRAHADANGSSISKLCRDAAAREMLASLGHKAA